MDNSTITNSISQFNGYTQEQVQDILKAKAQKIIRAWDNAAKQNINSTNRKKLFEKTKAFSDSFLALLKEEQDSTKKVIVNELSKIEDPKKLSDWIAAHTFTKSGSTAELGGAYPLFHEIISFVTGSGAGPGFSADKNDLQKLSDIDTDALNSINENKYFNLTDAQDRIFSELSTKDLFGLYNGSKDWKKNFFLNEEIKRRIAQKDSASLLMGYKKNSDCKFIKNELINRIKNHNIELVEVYRIKYSTISFEEWIIDFFGKRSTELEHFKYVGCYNIKNFNFLKSFPNLKILDLAAYNPKDFDFLIHCSNLVHLEAYGDNFKFSDILYCPKLESFIGSSIKNFIINEKHENLKSLMLKRCQVNWKYWKFLPNLQKLSLGLPFDRKEIDLSFLLDCQNIQSLSMWGCESIKNSDCLMKCSSLKEIDIDCLIMKNIDFFQYGKNLRKIVVSNFAGIIDLSPFQHCTNVSDFCIKNSIRKNFDFLSFFTELQNLEINYAEINHLSCLQKLSKLNTFSCCECSLGDVNSIPELSFLKNIKNLKLQKCDEDLTSLFLQNCSDQLQILSIIQSSIGNLEFLPEFVNLQSLELVASAIEDLSPLLKCLRLKDVTLIKLYDVNRRNEIKLSNNEKAILESKYISVKES